MKKLYVLPVLFCLCACDNNKIAGKCLTNRSTITTTEQDGKDIGTTITEFLLCGCFDDIKSEKPTFVFSEDEFLFESSYSFVSNDSEIAKPDNKLCNKKCTKLCKKRHFFNVANQ